METSINHAQEVGIVKLAEDGSAFTTSQDSLSQVVISILIL